MPTWMWISGGLNRAVARKAFEGRLPAIITRRTHKGGPGGFDLAIYRRNRAALLEHLRGGLLVDAGIVDTTLLDEPEDRSWRGTERIQHILRSEEHTSELQSLMRISSAIFSLKQKKHK